jgi:hypothetical protein
MLLSQNVHHKHQKAVSRLISFCRETRQGVEKRYEQFILERCRDTLTRQSISADPDMTFFYALYLAELNFNPWGVFIQHFLAIPTIKDNRAVRLCKPPKFLMPTVCLVCGESLGFQSYSKAYMKKVMHQSCADRWRKTIEPWHQKAMEVQKIIATGGEFTADLFEVLWTSYVELAHLYEKPYVQRFRLIEAYKDLPSTWPEPLWVVERPYELIQMPFFKSEIYDCNIFWEETRDEVEGTTEPFRPTHFPNLSHSGVTLTELDRYFLEKPIRQKA